jgi:hypothetical protein
MMLKAAVLLVLVLLLAAASLLRAQAQSTLLSLSKSTQLILGRVIVRAWDGLVNASQQFL